MVVRRGHCMLHAVRNLSLYIYFLTGESVLDVCKIFLILASKTYDWLGDYDTSKGRVRFKRSKTDLLPGG